jgi:hypothetical protein
VAERIADLVTDLEKARSEVESDYVLRIGGLSLEAESVIAKLRNASPGDIYHRAYRKEPDQMALVDVLTARDLKLRGYAPTNDPPIKISGLSAAHRDLIRKHATLNPLHETLWIGEALIEA